MVLGRVERYVIEQRPDGIVIRLDQRRGTWKAASLILAVLVGAGYLITTTRSGLKDVPFGLWVWMGMWVLVLLAVIAARGYWEEWTIGDRAVTWRRSGERTQREVPREALAKWRQRDTPHRGRHPVFPYQLLLLTREEHRVGEPLEFQRPRSPERFLKLIQPVLSLQVEWREDEVSPGREPV